MNNNKIFIALVLILILQLVLLLGIFYKFEIKTESFGSVGFNRFESNVTNSSVIVNTTSTTILAANDGRQYVLLTNDSANVIYLKLGSTATTSSGFRLNAVGTVGSTYEIKADNLYTGIITGIAAATSTVLTVEK